MIVLHYKKQRAKNSNTKEVLWVFKAKQGQTKQARHNCRAFCVFYQFFGKTLPDYEIMCNFALIKTDL